MANKNKFRYKDLGWDKIRKEVAAQQRKASEVKVGVLDDEELALIGTVQEFGSPQNNIPSRSFMRSTMKEEEANIKRMYAQGAKTVFFSKGEQSFEKEILEDLGEYLSDKVVKKIESNIGPALKEETIKAKGSSKTLIDTGALRDSITYKVERKK